MVKLPLEIILVKDRKYSSSSLRERLIIELGWKEECVWCGIGSEYNGKPLTLQLDHINGNHFDNRLENSRILCPSCHTQTKTWGMKNNNKIDDGDVIGIPPWFFEIREFKKSTKKHLCDICKVGKTSRKSSGIDGYRCKECYLKSRIKLPSKNITKKKKEKEKEKGKFDGFVDIPPGFFSTITKNPCDICKINPTLHKSKAFNGYRCKECSLKSQRKVKDRPSKEELIKLLETTSFVKAGKMYGVSDNAVRKWIK